MRYLLVAAFLFSLVAPGLVMSSSADAASCEFVLGFKTLHDLIPDIVGECLENAHHEANGDGLQRTTGGLLVWRKADNHTAFTDGYRTWVNGAYGLQQRLNTERFPWEVDLGAIVSPTYAYMPFGTVAWEENAGLTQIKLFIVDENGNPVNGVQLRVESAYGGWGATSNPTGAYPYAAGWTDFALRGEPVAARWNLWVTNEAGEQLSPLVQVETNTDLSGQGHQVATVRWRVNKPGLLTEPTPPVSPGYRFSASGAVRWEANAGLTQIKLYVKDRQGNPVDGVRFRIQTADGGWSAISNPTGATSYSPGWTDFALREEPMAATWVLWALDEAGNIASEPMTVVTDTNDPQPGGAGHQIATVSWTKNF